MLHQHHLLVGNFHFPLIKEANRLFATPMLPAIIISRPRKEVNPFRGAFLLRVSPGALPASGDFFRADRRAADLRAGDVARAGCPTVARGVLLRPLFVPAVRSFARRKGAAGRAYPSIRLRGLARAMLLSQAACRRLPLCSSCQDGRGAPSYIYINPYRIIIVSISDTFYCPFLNTYRPYLTI